MSHLHWHSGPAAYARRRPEPTVLYRLVQQHLETYLAPAREGDGDGQRVLPSMGREFRRYRECGILACGCCRVRCPACGHDFLVAFSCKGRGVCPWCNGALRGGELRPPLRGGVQSPSALPLRHPRRPVPGWCIGPLGNRLP
ncbi:MAG: transposase zinc-binding domain-containing protein [Chromatiaceae bacterium]|nr:transposase zinc-binding domain-containing protein [Chromatiaceae bacterium]MBP8283171.1 transposase zinc-binding domain-containing protein [Chromatiaceae bacterium]